MMKYILLVSLFFASLAHGETSQQKGLRIAVKMQKANDGFIGESSEMEMVLIDAYGSKITRKMSSKVLEVSGDGDKSLMTFLNPKDVKGTKMLTWAHKDTDDQQWLYLPSFRRVKKISSSNKTSSFMGSEFSYEDLGSQEVDKYSYNFIKNAKIKKHKIWIIDRFPKLKSGYSKQRLYNSTKYMGPIKIEYFDKRGGLLKVAKFGGYKGYNVKGKKLYRASKIHIKNVQTKKESIFTWTKRSVGSKVKSRDFKKSALKK